MTTTIDKLRGHIINLHVFDLINGDARIEMESLCDQVEAKLNEQTNLAQS